MRREKRTCREVSVVQQSSQKWNLKKHWLLSLSQPKRVGCSRNLKLKKNLTNCLEQCYWILIYILLHFMLTRLIQTAKRTLLIILGSRRLSLDVFRTILVETEAILNSRPLTIVADLPENEMLLTPNHFLNNRPFNSLPPGKFDSQEPASFKSWKNLQQMVNHFWKGLVKEYLPTLLKRSKWPNTTESQRHCLDSERYDSTWNLAPWTCSRTLPWTRWTTPCGEGENGLRHVRSPGIRARTRFGWLAHFFLTFFRNGSLGNLSYTLYDDLVNRLWWVSWPPLSPGACRATIKSEVKLEKTLTFVLIATKTSWLFPQLKTEKKS